MLTCCASCAFAKLLHPAHSHQTPAFMVEEAVTHHPRGKWHLLSQLDRATYLQQQPSKHQSALVDMRTRSPMQMRSRAPHLQHMPTHHLPLNLIMMQI